VLLKDEFQRVKHDGFIFHDQDSRRRFQH
jgi:hypothetical protein